ncbi:sialate O-acetylesterase [Massilia cellulosiltytica]|uniref:sialate O-acetylesterase n=1 Tax=Massilia cellulosiltytica TaxID=2683234 RepID=UPI0039B60907
MKQTFLLLALAACVPAHAADLGLARIFSDHAVLQRDQPIAVWGTAGAGGKVTVTLGGQAASASADAQGKWKVQLPPQPAGGPYALTVASEGREVSRADILLGDVYLCSGQSNMEFLQRASTNAIGATYTAQNDRIRYLNVPRNSALAPQDDLLAPAAWTPMNADTIGDASAVCYYMARSLQADYKVPVGFIQASWGGTTIQGWIGAESLRTFGDYKTGIDLVAQYGTDPAAAQRAQDARTEAWWRAHDPATAAQRAFVAPDFDDSAWESVTPAGSGVDGVTWYRTTVMLTDAQARAANALHLGPVDTYDTTWVNGQRVGGAGLAWLGRDYTVPAGVFQPGRNVIVMRVLGSGGMTGAPANRTIGLSDGQAIPLPAAWKIRRGSALKGLAVPPAPWDMLTSYTTLYNGMIAPLVGYKFKLAAWYQGEANADAADEYRSLLPMLMRDWRQRFGQPALPFLVVQLTSYGATATQPGASQWAELRAAQADTVAHDPHAGLAVTLDVGDRFDIHPTQKTVVGERLARAARAVAYGAKTAPGSPTAVAAARKGKDIVVTFRDTGGGLKTYSADRAIGFEVCAGKACRYADARVAGDRIVLPGAARAGVTRVRYAWADAPFVNLFGGDGLPAAPFQLDVR